MPAAVARPVVSVSMHTSGASGGGWPGRSRQPLAVERQLDRRDRPAHDEPAGVVGDVGPERGGEARRQRGAPPAAERRPGGRLVGPDRRAAGTRERRPQVRQPALAADARGGLDRHATACASRPPGRQAGQQPQRERLAVDARLEPRPGAGGAARVARTGADEVRRSGDSSSWRANSRSDSPTPPGIASYR